MTINTAPKTSDAFNSFELHKGDWERFNWEYRYVNTGGSPVPTAIWVRQLLNQFDYTYTDLAIWLQASADDPEWQHAIYAGFDIWGNAYIVARNVEL